LKTDSRRIYFRSVVLTLIIFINTTNLIHPQENIRSKIAIMLIRGNESYSLKSNDRVNVGDSIWILIQPVTKVFAYVVYSDENLAVLLKSTDSTEFQRKHILDSSTTLILPSQNEAYVLDELNLRIKFSIICSKFEISKIEKLFKQNNTVRIDLWYNVEQNISKQFSLTITSKMEKPISVAGNVRGNIGTFLTEQPIFEGKEVIIRTYNIEIKK